MIVFIIFCLFSFGYAFDECRRYTTKEIIELDFSPLKEVNLIDYSRTTFNVNLTNGKLPAMLVAHEILVLNDSGFVFGSESIVVHVQSGKLLLAHTYMPRCDFLHRVFGI
jgi:hypothetical protein